jgi:hypothetical protein
MRSLASIVDRAGLAPANVVDLASVRHGIRPLGLLHVPAANLSTIEEMLRDAGLRSIHRRTLARRRDSASHDSLLQSIDDDTDRVRSDAAEERWHEIWFALDGRVEFQESSMARAAGELLGYPPCCVRSNSGCASLAPYYRSYLNSAEPALWQANRLATALTGTRILPDYFPCSMHCQASASLADRCREAIRSEVDEATVNAWIRDLKAPITLWAGSLILWRSWSVEAETLTLNAQGAVSVPLNRLAQLPEDRAADGPRLVPSKHLGRRLRLRLVASDGASTESELRLLGCNP